MGSLAIDGGQPVRTQPMPSRCLIGQEEKQAAMRLFDEAIASGQPFGYNGPNEKQYEEDFARFMGGGYADGVNSGTNALFVALGALGLDAFSEVIVPPISDPGGVMPVIFIGCVPVVADADVRSYNTCADEIERMITERTRAIVVAHIGGDPVDMDPVMALARKHNLYVVEDCAQAHGARYKGKMLGTFGHTAAFSMMFGKHHCTGGQGGVVYTQDEAMYWRIKRFADRGKPFNLDAPGNVTAGLNNNLNELSAAIGVAQLAKLPTIVQKRHRIGEAVKAGLAGRKAVSVGWQPEGSESSYWFLRIAVNPEAIRVDKASFCKALNAEGIPATEHYRHIPGEAPWFKNKATFGTSGFPWNCSDYRGGPEPRVKIENAIAAAERHFNISMHENYGPRETQGIIDALVKVEAAYLR